MKNKVSLRTAITLATIISALLVLGVSTGSQSLKLAALLSDDTGKNTVKHDCKDGEFWIEESQSCVFEDNQNENHDQKDNKGDKMKKDDPVNKDDKDHQDKKFFDNKDDSMDKGNKMEKNFKNEKNFKMEKDFKTGKDDKFDDKGNKKMEDTDTMKMNDNNDNMGQNNGDHQGPNNCFEDSKCREKSLKQDLKDIERLIKESKKDQSLVDELTKLKEDLNNAKSQDEVDSIREKIQEIQRKVQNLRMSKDIERMQKDLDNQKKHSDKDKKFLEKTKKDNPELADEIDKQMERMDKVIELQKKMLEAMKSMGQSSDPEDWDSINSIREEMDNLREEMDNFWPKLQKNQDQNMSGRILADVEKEIAKFQNSPEYKNLSKELKIKADEIIATAKSLVEEGKKCQKDEDEECMMSVGDKLQELGQRAETVLGQPNSDFEDRGYDKGSDAKIENYTKDMSREKKTEILKSILNSDPSLMQDLLKDEAVVKSVLRVLDRMPKEFQSGFLDAKSKIRDLYNEIYQTNPDILNSKEDILDYNYYGTAQDELISALGKVLNKSMTLAELKGQFNEWKDSSREAKAKDGVISFKDVDDNAWYNEAVEGMRNFLKGKDGRYAGEDRLSYAEALKIGLEVLGKGQSSNEPSYPGAKNHWAKGYYAEAEKSGGITLLDPDHFITRGEMSRLIIEIALGGPQNHSTASFSDLSVSDKFFNFVETLKDYGIISGDKGKSTVRPNDTLNRAEAAKMFFKASKAFQLQTLNTEDLKNLVTK
ncbi:S-layer homology domain-containing protein [Candidatus Peregrinibacteria bacterium]|nr:S-layer homology domain-containing protein [Candidatus Peregrinibacteria bacterium]MBI5753833.1 S-layer homology domain-containing protein [Candidatus Peregrinibacteria bacterium]